MRGVLGVHTGWASTSPDREWLPSGDVALVEDVPLKVRKAEQRNLQSAQQKRSSRADGDGSDEEPLLARRERLSVANGAHAGSWGSLEGELLAGTYANLIHNGLCRLRRSETRVPLASTRDAWCSWSTTERCWTMLQASSGLHVTDRRSPPWRTWLAYAGTGGWLCAASHYCGQVSTCRTAGEPSQTPL